MADDRIPSTPAGGADGGSAPARGGRPPGGRDAGGFRIRLSDNEMQAARALQEAFGLRSTVAVLGFSLRALAQQLEQGQLDALIEQQRAQGAGRAPAPREGGRGTERRRDRAPGDRDGGRGGRGPRVDPFARPSRPAAAAAEPETAADAAAEMPLADEAGTASPAHEETAATAEVEAAPSEPAAEAADADGTTEA